MKTKSALRNGDCPWCQEAVSIGQELFPVLESLCQLSQAKASSICTPSFGATNSSRQCVWVHAPCALQVFAHLNQPVEPPPCRHWSRLGRCPFGDQCFFTHPHIPTIPQPPQARRTWGGKRRKLFKPTASIFRAWLLQTFGHDYLLQIAGSVLDIAGGKGELAFELQNLSGIATCVVDPRPLTLKSAYQKYQSGHYDKAAANPVLNQFLTHYNTDVPPTYPQHLRVFLDQRLIQRVLLVEGEQQPYGDDTLSLSEWWKQCRDYAQQQAWTRKGLESKTEEGDEDNIHQGDREEDPWLENAPGDIADASQALKLLLECSLVLGMHPDQATEAAVDFALATNKPFAVVPCCVFSSHFPNRRLFDGTPVKSTNQLVQYLKEKDPSIQVDTLPFEGMNQVVYRKPLKES